MYAIEDTFIVFQSIFDYFPDKCLLLLLDDIQLFHLIENVFYQSKRA